MNIGFVGLGKLGLPVALSIENKGHSVIGTDIDERVKKYIEDRKIPYIEDGTQELLNKTNIKFTNTFNVVENSDIVFVPIQTPHREEYEGITRIPEDRVDFDYQYLKKGIKEIADIAVVLHKHIILVVISTVLPGTFEKELKPLINKYIDFIYNPFFIAMGTTRADFENPEFVLLGFDDPKKDKNIWMLKKFYATIHKSPIFITTVKNAELIKVVYNTFISTKIAYINTIAQVCHKIGANIDVVTEALSLAKDRIISNKYLTGGMGDGGGCHPRDNIALSFLAKKVELSYDFFESIMISREKHADFLVDLIERYSKEVKLPIVLLGVSYKKNINLTVGSHVSLVKNILNERSIKYDEYDDYVFPEKPFYNLPALYFIGIDHDYLKDRIFPKGSVVIDPWGIIKDSKGVDIIKVGRL
jgi:UDPglucose 6-dehydrogenase